MTDKPSFVSSDTSATLQDYAIANCQFQRVGST